MAFMTRDDLLQALLAFAIGYSLMALTACVPFHIG